MVVSIHFYVSIILIGIIINVYIYTPLYEGQLYPFMIIFIIISTVIISVLTYVSWRKYKAMKQQEKERHR